MDYPKLRPVNVLPVQVQEGRTLICLQDPQNISERAVLLPPQYYFVISLFDGKHSILDIQAEYMRRFGEFLFSDEIKKIVDELDQSLFLESERFKATLREKEEAFKTSAERDPLFAGKSYEADGLRLRNQIEDYFKMGSGPLDPTKRKTGATVKGAIAPHIDFQRGGTCYTFAHAEIWKNVSCRRFVILGISHVPTRSPYVLTTKNFKTPLGAIEVDREMIEFIQSRCDYDLFQDEIVHRSEHSIEFQCVFLRFLFPSPESLRIVPVLCGSFHEAVEKGISPIESESVRRFIDALKEAVSFYGEDICIIASADLAHIGWQFGDREGVRQWDLAQIEEEDRRMLRYAENVDAEGFSASIIKERDRRKICGFPAIYTMLHCLEAKEGKLLKYGQAYTPEVQSVVSFASMVFH